MGGSRWSRSGSGSVCPFKGHLSHSTGLTVVILRGRMRVCFSVLERQFILMGTLSYWLWLLHTWSQLLLDNIILNSQSVTGENTKCFLWLPAHLTLYDLLWCRYTHPSCAPIRLQSFSPGLFGQRHIYDCKQKRLFLTDSELQCVLSVDRPESNVRMLFKPAWKLFQL